MPELCHAYQPGKAEGDLHARLSRVERILEIALPQYAGTSGGASSPGSSDMKPPPPMSSLAAPREASPSSSHEDELREDELPNAVGTLQDQSGPFFGDEALGSVNATPILEQVGHDRFLCQSSLLKLPRVVSCCSAAVSGRGCSCRR